MQATDRTATDARIKELTIIEAPVEDEDPWATKPEVPSGPPEDTTAGAKSADDVIAPIYTSDPTVSNAALTEIDDGTTIIRNGHASAAETDSPVTNAPASTSIVENAGNAAAEEQWDTSKPAGEAMEDSYEIVPRPADEVDTPVAASASGAPATTSWAEEANEAAVVEEKEKEGNDGFHEVHHRGPRQHRGFGPGDRGRGRGRGGFRGRGGDRGDFRGRGRGGRGGPRGAPRGD